MDIREQLNKRKNLVVAICCVVIAVAIWFTLTHSTTPTPEITSQSYYTDDDGQTYFADAADKVVPFLHNNKEAVLAFVYRSGGKTSVHYMMRMAPSRKSGKSNAVDPNNPGGQKEFKRPGEKEWHAQPPGPIPSTDGTQPDWITP